VTKFSRKRKWVWIIFAIIAVLVLISDIVPRLYYHDVETAISRKMMFNSGEVKKPITTLTTINTAEGVVYIVQDSQQVVYALNFDIKKAGTETLYRVGDVIGISTVDDCMEKMHTVQYGSSEEILFGSGEDLMNECEGTTGQDASLITVEQNGQQKQIWYIIGTDGLPQFPDIQIRGSNFTVSKSWPDTISIIISLVVVFIIAFIFDFRIKRRERGMFR